VIRKLNKAHSRHGTRRSAAIIQIGSKQLMGQFFSAWEAFKKNKNIITVE